MPQTAPFIGPALAKSGTAIHQLMGSEVFQKFSKTVEEDYLHWDKFRYRVPTGFDPELAWALTKIVRQTRYKAISLNGIKNIQLKYTLPDIIQQELMLIDQELAGRLSGDDLVSTSNADTDFYIMSALQEEAITSSMLEGAATTRQEAREMLETERKPRNHGERMVLNNYQAIQFIREHRKATLTPDFLLELQSILTKDTLEHTDEIGRFRTATDNITVVDQRDNEIIHQPPVAEELNERLNALCAFGNAQDGLGFIHPVVRACILHFQIGYDHPFCDGNGRTARAIFYWSMLKNNYWLFEYLPISRFIYRAPVKYTRAYLYCETDEFDVTYFLMYHIKIIEMARQELKAHLQKKQQASQARKLFRHDTRINKRQREVVVNFVKDPQDRLTIDNHKKVHDVAYATARADLLDLTEWEYLKMVQVGKRFEFIAGKRILDEVSKDLHPPLFPLLHTILTP